MVIVDCWPADETAMFRSLDDRSKLTFEPGAADCATACALLPAAPTLPVTVAGTQIPVTGLQHIAGAGALTETPAANALVVRPLHASTKIANAANNCCRTLDIAVIPRL